MKYIKQYESKENFNVGDIVYCFDNKGYERDIQIGVPYTISKIDDRIKDYKIITIEELESKWSSLRFTKDINHPDIIRHNLKDVSNKYNL